MQERHREREVHLLQDSVDADDERSAHYARLRECDGEAYSKVRWSERMTAGDTSIRGTCPRYASNERVSGREQAVERERERWIAVAITSQFTAAARRPASAVARSIEVAERAAARESRATQLAQEK